MQKRTRAKGDELEVAFARSTWRMAKAFMDGVRELAEQMPLIYAREYLVDGTRRPEFAPELYDCIDELQALRKSGIGAEMRHVRAQVYCLFRDGKADASFVTELSPRGLSKEEAAIALAEALAADEANERTDGTCAELLIGPDLLSGDDIRFGVGADLLYAAPSLGVYELFMWFDENELPDSTS